MKMPPSSSIRIKIVAVLWLASTSGFAVSQQSSPTTPATSSTETKSDSTSAKAPLTPEEKKRADLVADTEKLSKLTQELKAEVAKSNKDTLSVSVVKKAQEVERLAKSIKDRSRSQ